MLNELKKVAVGVGELKVSGNTFEELKTYALGSCVAVIIYDTRECIAGMIHIALPYSSTDLERALRQPAYFADTGLSLLLDEMGRRGATKARSWIKIAGGANVLNIDFDFDIGKRNLLAVKKILWNRNLGPIARDTGGNMSRTVSVRVDNGEVMVSSNGGKWLL